MIDFFQEGSNIGFSINGIDGVVLLIYLIIELSFFFITKTFLIHKLFLGLRVHYQVRKMIPKYWYIEKISYLSINKNRIQNKIHDDYGRYEVYIEVRSKINLFNHNDSKCFTNDWIKVNWLGKIKKQDLISNIELEDGRYKADIKQWSRNKILEDIGI